MNGTTITLNPSAKLVACNRLLQRCIRETWPGTQRAEHVGNAYGKSLGDIRLHFASGQYQTLELKYLEQGSGTRANISQNGLTDYGVFTRTDGGPAVSWSAYREQTGHAAYVENVLTRALGRARPPGLPQAAHIDNLASELKSRLELEGGGKVSVLARARQEIVEYDAREKARYIEYLQTQRFDDEAAFRFIALILTGNHTAESFRTWRETGREELLLRVSVGYSVLYAYKRTMSVEREDVTPILTTLGKARLGSEYDRGLRCLILTAEAAGRSRKVLRVAFHWKNIFQGIKTPCLNIFDEELVKSANV